LLLEKIKMHDVLAISTIIEGMCFELDMNENFVD
jgi:predicted RNA-binding protein